MGNRQLGATEGTQSNVTYLNLRIGKMAQTSNEKLPGFVPVQTKNKSGVEFNFFAKPFDELYGYVKSLKFYDKTLTDGTVLTGILVGIDCGEHQYMLDVGSKDRPYRHLLEVMADVDFEEPVLFVAFMGKSKKDGKPQKVLLLSQEDDAGGKPIWLWASTYKEKYLSRELARKLADGVELTDDEIRNVAYDAKGKPIGSKDFPYIKQKADMKWSFEAWEEFLFEKVSEEVIPLCREAADARAQNGTVSHTAPAAAFVADDDDDDRSTDDSDDDIPF